MSKSKELLSKLREAQDFTKQAISPHQKDMRKAGTTSTTAGRTTTITNRKTGRKVQITDTGKELKVKRMEAGKPAGKDTKMRGSAADVGGVINWAGGKDK